MRLPLGADAVRGGAAPLPPARARHPLELVLVLVDDVLERLFHDLRGGWALVGHAISRSNASGSRRATPPGGPGSRCGPDCSPNRRIRPYSGFVDALDRSSSARARWAASRSPARRPVRAASSG